MGDALAAFIDNLVFPCMRKFVVVASSGAYYLIHHHLRGCPYFNADCEGEFFMGSKHILDKLINILAGLLVLNRLDGTKEGQIKCIGIW